MDDITYIFRVSSRARRVRLTVSREGQVTLTAPRRVSRDLAEKFLHQKLSWVQAKVAQMKKLPPRSTFLYQGMPVTAHSRRDYLAHREAARKFITARATYWSRAYGFPFRKLAIRDQSSRWGSCSLDKNLNFNYRLLFVPPEVADYVIVHEICHLSELNHSKKFWDLVARAVPDFRARRKELRKYSLK
jgi:predicted metal-dependent hydrolase